MAVSFRNFNLSHFLRVNIKDVKNSAIVWGSLQSFGEDGAAWGYSYHGVGCFVKCFGLL
jgi:hypothetical protein